MFEAIKKIIQFSGKEKSNIYKAILVSFFRSIFSMLRISAIYFIVLGFEQKDTTMKPAFIALLLLFISLAGNVALKIVADLFSVHAGYFMTANKRLEIADRLKKVPMGYLKANNLSDVTGVATTVLDVVENQGAMVLVNILTGLINSLVFLCCIPFLDIRISLIVLVGMVLYLLVTSSMEKKSRKLSPLRQKNQATLVTKVLESLQGMSVIKSYNLTGKGDASLHQAIDNNRDSNLALEKLFIPYGMVQSILLGIFKVLILLVSVLLYLNNGMTMTTTLILIILSFQVFADIEQTGAGLSILRIVSSSIEEAEKVNLLPVMDENGKDYLLDNHNISIENVSFAYDQKDILKDISLTIPEKTMTAFVGPSGAGKTTLAMLIARFWDVNKGKITIGNKDVRDYTLESLMSKMSVVFQNVYLFADTIENNIKFGSPSASFEEVELAAKKACCHDFIMSLPEGYNTVIGEGGATLSGGEKQRISIARAILKDAPIIILDEATANIDPENEDKLVKAFDSLTENKTVIMIAHRLNTVLHANQIVVIDEGHIVQKGRHEELIQQDGIYKNFVKRRQEAAAWKIATTE